MGLLDKTNPNATRDSVVRHAKIWAAVMAVAYPVACIWEPWLRDVWPIGYPLAVAFGAAIGALMEWQLDD